VAAQSAVFEVVINRSVVGRY